MSLKTKAAHLTTIEDWYNTQVGTASKLTILFNNAIGQTNVFSTIYVAIRDNPQYAEQTEHFSYYNVGYTDTQISDYFVTKFGLNYFAYRADNTIDFNELRMKIKSIYDANLYKYRKLVEILGYTYNPLFNVDGTELYSRAESIGDAQNVRTPSGSIITETGTEKNQALGNTTTTFYKNPYDNNSTSANVVDAKTEQSPVKSIQTYSDEYNETTDFKNIPANNYKYDETTQEWKPDGVFSVAAKDNAFGIEFNGPERYYAEKKIRQGNIGVTKSTELIAAQRELVRYNILDEFFRDLYREIVVGIY